MLDFFSQGLVSFDGLLSLKSLKMVMFFFLSLIQGLGSFDKSKPSSPRSEGVKARKAKICNMKEK